MKKLKLVLPSFNNFDFTRIDTYQSDLGNRKVSDVNPVDLFKIKHISSISAKYLKDGMIVFDAGCKKGEMAKPLLDKKITLFGLDLNRSTLHHFQKRTNHSVIQGDVQDLPIGKEKFDFILFTDIIEHLHDPLEGLEEILNTLKPGGIIIITTDNRNHVKIHDLINPLILIERLTGLVCPGVLTPKSILWEHGDNIRYYHTSFSRMDFHSLLDALNVEVVSFFSYMFLPGFHEILSKIFPGLTEKDYTRVLFPIERILYRIPVIKFLGDHWLIILRKRSNPA